MIVRRAQLEEFERHATREFEHRAIEHARSGLAGIVVLPDSLQLERLIHDVVARVRSFGIQTERGIVCLFDAELLLGVAFYQRPEHDWARRVLESTLLTPNDKSEIVLGIAIGYFKTSQSDCSQSL